MSVERMKLLSITGKEENIEKFISDYLLDSGLQTEDAVKVYEKNAKLTNFSYDSSAKDLRKKCEDFMEKYKIKYKKDEENENIDKNLDYAERVFDDVKKTIDEFEDDIVEDKKTLEDYQKRVELFSNVKDLDVDFSRLYSLEFIKFRYGKILKENFGKLENAIKDLNAFLVKTSETSDGNYYWIMCFSSIENAPKVDSYLNVYKLEKFNLPDGVTGKPNDIYKDAENKVQEYKYEIERKEDELIRIIQRDTDDLIDVYRIANTFIKINNVKRYMAYDENGQFYIIGWIPAKELNTILPKLSKEKDLKYVIKNHDEVASTPPTKLNNNIFFKPFEVLIKMYGLPNYTELDPTAFVAITAFFLFGFMFGDVGHGLVIFLIGLIMWLKKSPMGPVFEAGGIAAIFFGIFYGSVFGLEDIIPALIIRPMDNIQTMLICGIGFGVFLILVTMILNIKNGIRNKDFKKIFFDTNGIAGLVFYTLVVIVAGGFLLTGKLIVSFTIIAIFLIVPLILIMFKDVLAEKIFKQKAEVKTGLFEKIFNVVEILLSFTSNTISFVRIAAFAINHVGLCMAVYILYNMFTGVGGIITILVGNIIVIVLEGLIVGIQVLRLEYYELFSRFYSGDGREYKPLREKI